MLVATAGAVWGLFNTALAMIFAFGITVLTAAHWSLASSGFAVSMVLWLAICTVPVGGILADRLQIRSLLVTGSTIVAAGLMLALSRTSSPLPFLIMLGLVCGLPAGAMMAMPAMILRPENRAAGMAVFFTVFYVAMSAGPVIAGRFAAYTGHPGAALDFGAALLIACPILTMVFMRMRQTSAAAKPAVA